MFHKVFITLLLLPFLAACNNDAVRVNQMHQSEALKLVNQDLTERVQKLHLETPGYVLHTIGQPGAGSFDGNGVFFGLVPANNGTPIDLPLEYDYTYTVSSDDSHVTVRIVHSPSDEELRSAIDKALHNH